MGRTRGTFRIMLEKFANDWQTFRRALRRENQPYFDAIIEKAERFAGPAGNQNPAHPIHGILISIVLAQEAERQEIETEVRNLQEQVEKLEAELDGTK